MQLRHDWRRLGLQLGLLGGIGLAFALGSGQRAAVAGGGGECPVESECPGFRKPNLVFILDDSTAMNELWDLGQELTRWQVAVATVEQLAAPGGLLSQNTQLALLRFGHDPDPGSDGTTIPGDGSGMIDGSALDVEWDDDEHQYFQCAGQSILDSLAATPPPLEGAQTGIDAWTKGALDRVAQEIAQTRADHPDDQGQDKWTTRQYVIVLLTQGAWTNADGSAVMDPVAEDPAITAQQLFDDQGIATYVVSFAGDPQAQLAADQLAEAGGTAIALVGGQVDPLQQALGDFIWSLIPDLIGLECQGGLPRGMILLDASSAMLNVGGAAGSMGATGWDQAREAIAGRSSIFEAVRDEGTVEDLTHLGLAVFGGDAPGEQELLVQYAPCAKDNFAWALDPQTSCAMPGCVDPWAGPPITWTFLDGSQDPWGFDHPTRSHMPRCEGATLCSGSGSYLHLGLSLVADNQAEYHAAGMLPQAMYPTNPATPYFNVLITEGRYDGYSTDAQVQAELEAMYDGGINTYVVGFGDGADTPQAIAQLEKLADWGSGGTDDHYGADSQLELEAALASILEDLELDPCCLVNDCSQNPEPTTNEPDPIPTTGDGDDGGDGDGDDPGATDEPPDPPGDGDPDGDGDPSDGDGDSDDEAEATGNEPALDLNDRGCECRLDDGDSSRERLGAALLLVLSIGFARRRSAMRRR